MAKKGRVENLKPFKKGVDERRNMEGRPPKLPHLDELLAEVLGEEKDGLTAAKVILMALRKKATAGDVRAAEVLLDRAFGKAKQSSEINLKGELKHFILELTNEANSQADKGV